MHVRKGKVGGWREELDPDDIAFIEHRYGDVMKRMGYQLESDISSDIGMQAA